MNLIIKEKEEIIESKENNRETSLENQNNPHTKPSNNMNNINNTNMNMTNMNGEKCDGCFEGYAVCFCVNCEKIFCKMCEDQIHIVPSNRHHER